MRIAQINSFCGKGSTGKICVGISQVLTSYGFDNIIFYTANSSNYTLSKKCSNIRYIKLQALFSRIFGNYGFNSYIATKVIIKKLDKYRPDLVHIHNIHSHDVNFEMLFHYLRNKNIKVVYTFHDCWAFTGYCPYFVMAKCDKWTDECCSCPLVRNYSWFVDKSRSNFIRKRKAVQEMNMTIVVPSQWLGNIVKASFLKNFPIEVINNGIDLKIFKPTFSNFKSDYNIDQKKVILGVADAWGERKGLDIFIKLSKRLPQKYQIVLVGTNNIIDKRLPTNIISIHKTQNQIELAKIYTAADLFVNPTREDNYPTVNMEALACGTPVLTFKTGGSPEIPDYSCGCVVDCDDIDSMEREIIRICETKPFTRENCLNRSKHFDANERFKDYVKLYNQIVGANK